MLLSDFSIGRFNQTCQEDVSKQDINFCKAIVLSHRKISATVKYCPEYIYSEYVVLDPNLNPIPCSDFDSYYYGASPNIDTSLILNAISNLRFTTVESLEKFIAEHCTDFMLHKDQADYLLDVAKLILLTVASKYGITFRLCSELSLLVNEADRFPEIITVNNKDKVINLHGCPTAELIELLETLRFIRKDGKWEPCSNGLSLAEIYANCANIQLLVGKVFYSGVLLKAVNITKQSDRYENDRIPSYQFQYERSTFATVCAFDDNRTLHPLLAQSRDKLINMFRADDACKSRLIKNLSREEVGEEEILLHVNEYLRSSFNVNQIGVSSNVKTSDGKIFFGLRGSNNIDSGSLYPGVNGNAEVYDENVSFYNNSVYEDLPSVYLRDRRSDLLGEISREAYAELRLTTKRESWECYGMIISGTAPAAETYSCVHRRCHFNVLFENEVAETMEQIKERKLKASESFENTNFAAIKVQFYKDRLHGFFSGIFGLVQTVLRSKDFVESLLLLMITFVSVSSIEFSLDNLSSLFSVVFASLILLSNLVQIIQFLLRSHRNAKMTRTMRIYANMSYPDLCRKVSETMNRKYHPAAYVALKMHVENMIYDHIKNE